MSTSFPTRSDVPGLCFMAAMFLGFGLFAILKPDALRSGMDNFANHWKEGIICSALFVYLAYVALSR